MGCRNSVERADASALILERFEGKQQAGEKKSIRDIGVIGRFVMTFAHFRYDPVAYSRRKSFILNWMVRGTGFEPVTPTVSR